MEEQDYTLFDQYLLGELSSEKGIAFDERLKIDSEFNKSFNTYKELSNFLENKFENEDEIDAFKSNLERISNSHFNQTSTATETNRKTKTVTLIKYLTAACIVVFLGIFAFNQFSNPTYSDYSNHEPMTIVRGANEKELTEAAKAFNNKEYEKANVLLKKVLENDSGNSELQLYYAITNIELDNYKIADVQLDKIISGNSAYKNRALWYAALSKLKQKKSNASVVLLKQIPEAADDYKEAQKLLDKLE